MPCPCGFAFTFFTISIVFRKLRIFLAIISCDLFATENFPKLNSTRMLLPFVSRNWINQSNINTAGGFFVANNWRNSKEICCFSLRNSSADYLPADSNWLMLKWLIAVRMMWRQSIRALIEVSFSTTPVNLLGSSERLFADTAFVPFVSCIFPRSLAI